jgi:hypothetical protein
MHSLAELRDVTRPDPIGRTIRNVCMYRYDSESLDARYATGVQYYGLIPVPEDSSAPIFYAYKDRLCLCPCHRTLPSHLARHGKDVVEDRR